jgi:hypothetical protein
MKFKKGFNFKRLIFAILFSFLLVSILLVVFTQYTVPAYSEVLYLKGFKGKLMSYQEAKWNRLIPSQKPNWKSVSFEEAKNWGQDSIMACSTTSDNVQIYAWKKSNNGTCLYATKEFSAVSSYRLGENIVLRYKESSQINLTFAYSIFFSMVALIGLTIIFD